MRRYELMTVLRADIPEDRIQSTIERIIRTIAGADGQVIKVSPWGRRRLAYEISHQREGSYHIVVFEAEAAVVAELERGLHINEDVLRHLVTRIERPARARRVTEETEETEEEIAPPSEEPEEPEGERIDESESEAAPAAIERD